MATITPTDSLGAPMAFSFKVVVDGLPDSDQSFREVGGIGSELEIEDVVEGGENRFVHRLPKEVKHPRLVLKHGIAWLNAPLVAWCRTVLESGFDAPITTKQISLYLLDHEEKPLRVWAFADAYPVKCEFAGLDAPKDKIAIETIELIYSVSKRLA